MCYCHCPYENHLGECRLGMRIYTSYPEDATCQRNNWNEDREPDEDRYEDYEPDYYQERVDNELEREYERERSDD